MSPQIPRPVGLPPTFAARVIQSVPVAAGPRIMQTMPAPQASVSPIAARIAPVAPSGQVLPFRGTPSAGPSAGSSSTRNATQAPDAGNPLAFSGAASQTGTGYGSSAASSPAGAPGATVPTFDSSGAASSAPAAAAAVDDSSQPGSSGGAAPAPAAPAAASSTPATSNTKRLLVIAAVVVAAALAVYVLFIRKPKRKANPFAKALKAKAKKRGRK